MVEQGDIVVVSLGGLLFEARVVRVLEDGRLDLRVLMSGRRITRRLDDVEV